MVTHKHHIVPRHMGGSDEPENLIELPLWAHIEVHRRLYEVYGKLEDKIAYCMLSGKTEEAEKLRVKLANKEFQLWLKEKPEEVEKWKQNISNTLKGKRYLPDEHYKKVGNLLRDKPRTQEVKDKISKAKKGKEWVESQWKTRTSTYEVTKPNGEVVVVQGLNKFCKEEGISAPNLCAVAKGRLKQHKGYRARLIE